MSNPAPRVVVTGIGALTPMGNDAATTWTALRAGSSGVGPITRFDATALPTRIAGEVRDFDPVLSVGRKEARRMSRVVLLAMAAAREAVGMSRLDIAAEADDIGVVIGTGMGGMDVVERATLTIRDQGPRRVWPFSAAAMLPDMVPGMIAIDHGARGPNCAVISACASGAQAIGEAAELIKRGDAVAVVTGGAEAAICMSGLACFAVIGATTTRNEEPERASRPFDRSRDGFVPAEGAVSLILEEREHALRRGATILGELTGYSATADAGHITQPDPDGAGARRCMTRALARAGLVPEQIGYINAHGTGTPLNDIAETRALKAVLGDAAYSVPVSSTKSMTGHLMGAAGALEAMVTLLALRDGFLPPTINLDDPDAECDLDYVAHTGRAHRADHAMSTSFGFGGHNCALVFARAEAEG